MSRSISAVLQDVLLLSVDIVAIVGDHKYDQVTADNPISRKEGRSYFQLIPAVQEKYTRVSKFNMNKFSGWKWKRRRMDRIHSL